MSNSITERVTVDVPNISQTVNVTVPNLSGTLDTGFTAPFGVTINNGASGFTLPLVNGVTYNFYVNWGDGTRDHITAWNQAEATHAYSDNAEYIVWVEPGALMPRWSFNNGGSCTKLLQINSWGDVAWGSNMGSAFFGCSNLVFAANGGNFAATTTFSSMFKDCTSLLLGPDLNMSGGGGNPSYITMYDGCSSMVTFPNQNFRLTAFTSGFQFTFRNCTSLVTIGAASNLKSFTGTYTGCSALESILATGIVDTTSFLNCNMSAAALDVLFHNLETVSAETITVTGNPGAGTCNTAIAVAKGWTVVV